MKTIVNFEGIDAWNRPIFKDVASRDRYGVCDKLFDRDATAEKVLEIVTEKDLLFFGATFNCEPMGTPIPKNLVIELV